MKRLAILTLSLALLSGCAARVKNVTNLPPGVSLQQVQGWDTAVSDLDKFSTAVSSVRQAVISLNRQGVFPDGPQYTATLQGIAKADNIEIEAANFLKSVPNDWSQPTQQRFAAYASQIATALSDVTKNGTIGIKNTSSQQQVVALISNAAAIIGIILSV